MDWLTALIYFSAKVIFLGIFIAIGWMIFKGFLCLGGLFYQIAKAAFGTNDNTVVQLYYNPHAVEGSQNGLRHHTGSRNSSFFDDAGGLDLEYRGVGTPEARREESMLGKAVSKRAVR